MSVIARLGRAVAVDPTPSVIAIAAPTTTTTSAGAACTVRNRATPMKPMSTKIAAPATIAPSQPLTAPTTITATLTTISGITMIRFTLACQSLANPMVITILPTRRANGHVDSSHVGAGSLQDAEEAVDPLDETVVVHGHDVKPADEQLAVDHDDPLVAIPVVVAVDVAPEP